MFLNYCCYTILEGQRTWRSFDVTSEICLVKGNSASFVIEVELSAEERRDHCWAS